MTPRTAIITERDRLLNDFFKVDKLTIAAISSQGEPMRLTRLVFERGHAAAILPYDPRTDQVVLISEMRPGILSAGDDPYSLSIVAGMIDAGEDGLKTVLRESIEEAGIAIQQTYKIHPGLYVSPGGTSEKIALYCGVMDASQVAPFAGKPEEGEDIQTHVMSYRDFSKLLSAGQINDMKTVLAGYWLQKNRSRIRRNFGHNAARLAISS